MTSALTKPRYKSYQEYLDDESLSPDVNYRLLDTGALIEVASEDDDNLMIASILLFQLMQLDNGTLKRRVRIGNKEIQVPPVGDARVNRKPDVMVLHPSHREVARQAVKFGMAPPVFVAEVVSPGDKNSENYQRDYVWKRQQYQWWKIPEYWIIDPHLECITVLILIDEQYDGRVYSAPQQITSTVFPTLKVSVQKLLAGDL